ncbi:MAG: MerR family transcriptional regulator [Roseburia sp.]
MEYTIRQLAELSGISARTLRYYDQIDLLCPARMAANDYRIYGQEEVDLLQQILFYRELGVGLKEIKNILSDPSFDKQKALEGHLSDLRLRKNHIETLNDNVTKTISSLKGESIMSNNEKFEGFKQKMLDDNEAAYGAEIRERYGDEAVEASNAKVKGMSEAEWQRARELGELINSALKEAFEQRDPAGETAQRACALHREWLCMFWKDGMYTKEAHRGISESYVADERFTRYYDKIAPGCTEFLRDAIQVYCG